MTKESLLMWLREAFSAYPQEEVEERLRFYEEMIDDRMEEGLTEEEAVASLGSLEEVIAKMGAEMPPLKTGKEKRRLQWWEILLLVLGFPLWFPLLVAAASVALSLYACLWSVILSFLVGLVAIIVCSFFGILAGIGYLLFGKRLTGLVILGAGILLMGISIFWFWGCWAVSTGTWRLTKMLLQRMKRAITKEDAE